MHTSEERRHFSRVPIDGRVRLTCGRKSWETDLSDISLKGALFQRPAEWEPVRGELCQLDLMSDGSDALISMQGSVAHVGEEQVGFRCEFIDLDSISHLKRLLQLNLGDESLLQRELTELVHASA